MTTIDHSRLLRVEEVADRLALSKRTVRRMIKRGDLPYVQFRPGCAVRIPLESLRPKETSR